MDPVVVCDTCPLRRVCPCYAQGKPACVIGMNIALACWTAMMLVAVLTAMLASAAV